MKRLIGSVLAIAALGLLSTPTIRAADKAADGSVGKAIRQLEDDWAAALVKADKAVVDRIVAPEWVLTTPDGQMQTKAQADAELASGAMKFASFHLDDLQVKVYGDTAIAFGLETEKSTFNGKDVSGQYRFTDVFVKRGGRWMAVATHVSMVVKQ